MLIGDGQRVLILSDSITKSMKSTKAAILNTISGCTVKSLYLKLQDQVDMVTGYDYILLHIGTNDFGSKKEWLNYKHYVKHYGITSAQGYMNWCHPGLSGFEPVDSISVDHIRHYYTKIIKLIHSLNPNVVLIYSAVLPRFWDHNIRDNTRRSINWIIEDLAHHYGAIYLKT